jgi:hypothetical protein
VLVHRRRTPLLRCKEIWVVGADKWRNSAEDLVLHGEVICRPYIHAMDEVVGSKATAALGCGPSLAGSDHVEEAWPGHRPAPAAWRRERVGLVIVR